MKSLAYRVKRASNITTAAFVLFLAYTINRWHSTMPMDNFINLLVLLLIMLINIRFYKIFINIGERDKRNAKEAAEAIYKQQRKEYYQLLRISLWMAAAIVLIKVAFS